MFLHDWSAYTCEEDHLHATKYNAPEYPYFLSKPLPLFIPAKLIPVSGEHVFDRYRYIELEEQYCPLLSYKEYKAPWHDLCYEVKFAVGWTSSYKKFLEMSREVMEKQPPVEKFSNEEQKKILLEFLKSKPKPFSLLKYAWDWCNQLEKCALTQEEIIEKVIFKLPFFDLRLRLLYKKPENKYALIFLMYHYDATSEDLLTRRQFMER